MTTSPIAQSADKDDFRMYYQLQFERIAQLEQQRLTIMNFVSGISIVAFTFAFADLSKLNGINAFGIPFIIIVANVFAMIYANKSRAFIKMHQARARKALALYAAELATITNSVPKIESSQDVFNRTRLQVYLHIALIVIALYPMLVFFQ